MASPPRFDRFSATLSRDYELIRPVGLGGMATVFLAREKSLKRPVAIKGLSPELAGSAFPARFAREAETAAQLQHPRAGARLRSPVSLEQCRCLPAG